jgi:hypothetical protein
MDEVYTAIQNPYTELKLWMMYEIFEITALQEMIQKRREIQKVYDSTVTNTHTKIEKLETLERGGMTLNTFWKSGKEKQKMIESMNTKKDIWVADVVNTRLHLQLISNHLVH